MDRAIQGIAGETRVTVEGASPKTPARPDCANWAGRRNEPYCSFIHTLIELCWKMTLWCQLVDGKMCLGHVSSSIQAVGGHEQVEGGTTTCY